VGTNLELALSGLALGDFPLSSTNQGQVHQGLAHGSFWRQSLLGLSGQASPGGQQHGKQERTAHHANLP
jgi:hypothetical protein